MPKKNELKSIPIEYPDETDVDNDEANLKTESPNETTTKQSSLAIKKKRNKIL